MKVPTTLADKLKYCLVRQKQTFKRIGYWKYFSLLMFILMFTLFPMALKTIWPYVENSMPHVPLYFVTTIVMNVVITGLYNICMYFIYTKKWKFLEQYRSEPSTPWPWEANKQAGVSFVWKTIKVDSVNAFVVGALMTCVDSIMRMDLKMRTEECPAPLTMIWQFFFFLLVEQIFFYCSHRTLHHPKLYWLHKRHHQHTMTIALAFVYSSPVQHISNLVASGIAYKLLSKYYPVHIFTVIIWLTYRMIESMDGHSGYDFPWAISHVIPLSAGGNYHSFHHSKNAGNYGGILHIFDTLFETNHDYLKWEAIQNGKKENKSQ